MQRESGDVYVTAEVVEMFRTTSSSLSSRFRCLAVAEVSSAEHGCATMPRGRDGDGRSTITHYLYFVGTFFVSPGLGWWYGVQYVC